MINRAFWQVPADVEEAITMQAGILLSSFDPTSASYSKTAVQANIIMATSGGVSINCTPTVEDWADDVDNVPTGAKELQKITKYECKMSGTGLSINDSIVKRTVGAATVTTVETGYKTVEPKFDIAAADFQTLWYVVPYGTNGGFVAIEMSNTFSTGGFSFTSEKDGKGKLSFEFTGYGTVDDPTYVPMKFHIRTSSTEATTTVTAGGQS